MKPDTRAAAIAAIATTLATAPFAQAEVVLMDETDAIGDRTLRVDIRWDRHVSGSSELWQTQLNFSCDPRFPATFSLVGLFAEVGSDPWGVDDADPIRIRYGSNGPVESYMAQWIEVDEMRFATMLPTDSPPSARALMTPEEHRQSRGRVSQEIIGKLVEARPDKLILKFNIHLFESPTFSDRDHERIATFSSRCAAIITAANDPDD